MAVLAVGNTVLETAVLIPKCLRSIHQYTCTTDHTRGLIDTVLPCGPDYLPFLENQAAQCTRGEDNTYCYRAFSGLNTTHATLCSSIKDSYSCTPACNEFLMDTVSDGGCCVDTVFRNTYYIYIYISDERNIPEVEMKTI